MTKQQHGPHLTMKDFTKQEIMFIALVMITISTAGFHLTVSLFLKHWYALPGVKLMTNVKGFAFMSTR